MVVPKRQGPRQDNGLFGPGSVAWEVFGHPAAIFGLLNSAMVSLLSSEVAASINSTNVMRTDPLKRLEETNYFVYTAVFGDEAEARRAGKFVQGRHNRVKGHDPVTGNDLNPMRPDMAIMGHALTWLPPLWAYETYVRKLTPAERTQYWKEGFVWAELLGIDTSTTEYTGNRMTVRFPQTEAEWDHLYETVLLPRLVFTPAARQVFKDNTAATFAPWWARPLVRTGLSVFEEFGMAVFDGLERDLLQGHRSQLRVEAVRLIGRALMFGAANVAPVRDVIEQQGLRGYAHELLREAREIQRQASKATPTEHPIRVVAAS